MRASIPLLLLTGCVVVDAPEDFEDMVAYGFANFDGGEEYTRALSEKLIPYVVDNVEPLEEGYRVTALGVDELGAAGVEVTEDMLESTDTGDVVGIIGAASTVYYGTDLDGAAWIVTFPDKELMIENMQAYDFVDSTDLQCFLDKTCDSFEASVEETTEVVVIGVTTRRFTLEARRTYLEDGTEVITARTLAPEPSEIEADWLQVHQQYGYSFLFESEAGVRRIEGFWVDADVIGMDVPDYFAVEQAVGAMAKSAEEMEAYYWQVHGGGPDDTEDTAASE